VMMARTSAPVFLLSRGGDPAPLRALPPWLGAALVAQQLPVTPLMLRVAACHGAALADELGDDPLARLRVLAAEDQEINRVLLREMLATTGATLVCVENGRKVVEQLEADGPDAYDVVLCDIEMPELDGYEATLAMRAISARLPIVGLTAHAFELARERGRAVGMTDYLTKPYTLKNLVDVIARAIGRR
jgi:CheY-like chemotaxis protein